MENKRTKEIEEGDALAGGTWESLGNISSVVLSRLMKSLGKRRGDASPGNMLKPQLRQERTQGGNVVSN